MSETQSELPGFIRDLASWYAMQALALGHATGLREALLAGPGSALEIAKRANADLRSTSTWLATMVAGGYAVHDQGIFDVQPEAIPFLSGQIPIVDTLALLDLIVAFGGVVPAVIDSVRTGHPLPDETFGGVFGLAAARVNGPLYRNVLISDWLASDSELISALTTGVRVVDFGCGDGTAVRQLAMAFPQSQFEGVDRDLNAALLIEEENGLPNLSFSEELPHDADVIMILDAFHHFPDPYQLLAHLRTIVRDGGVLVIAESAYSGNLDVDTMNPFATIGFGSALLYCEQEGRVLGKADPIDARDGGIALKVALTSAGFPSISTHDGVGDYQIFFAR